MFQRDGSLVAALVGSETDNANGLTPGSWA